MVLPSTLGLSVTQYRIKLATVTGFFGSNPDVLSLGRVFGPFRFNPSHHRLFLIVMFTRRSKADQLMGTIVVAQNQTVKELCPVVWFRLFSSKRSKEASFFFHPVGRVKDATTPLNTPNIILRKLLESIGVDPSKFGSHSCRRGGCTMAVAKGVDMRLVAKHERWKSSAILGYVRDSLDTQRSVQAGC